MLRMSDAQAAVKRITEIRSNGLWHVVSVSPYSFVDGVLGDNTRLKIEVEYTDDRTFLIITANEHQEHIPILFLHVAWTNLGEVLNNWTETYWADVDNAQLWSAAGCSPDQARQQLALSANHPDRIAMQSLEVLAALHQP